MGIHDELRAELRDAMRTKDQRRLAALRQVESEAAVLKTAPGFSDPVDDAFYRRVIAAYVKKMQKAREEYAGRNRGTGEPGQEPFWRARERGCAKSKIVR